MIFNVTDGSAEKIRCFSAKLRKGSWDETTKMQTVAIDKLPNDEAYIIVEPELDFKAIYSDCGIQCVEQGVDYIVFKCDEIPTETITMKIGIHVKTNVDRQKNYITVVVGTANASIDLSGLTGLEQDSIDWGDGTVTTDTSTHTYTATGTYKICANFDDVTAIGDDFLANCTQITNVDLGDVTEVETIGTGFLDGCTALTEITLPKGIPATLGGWGAITAVTKIHTGEINLEKYKAAPVWTTKATMMEA